MVKTLLKYRTYTSFSLFWARILQRKATEILIRFFTQFQIEQKNNNM